MQPDKWQVCRDTNAAGVTGGIAEALVDANVCLAFSQPGPDTIRPEWIATNGGDSIPTGPSAAL